MSYLADVTNALSQSNGQGPSHLSVDGEERAIEVDSDWVEELAVEEEDSQAEDSVSTWSPPGRPAGSLPSARAVMLTAMVYPSSPGESQDSFQASLLSPSLGD